MEGELWRERVELLRKMADLSLINLVGYHIGVQKKEFTREIEAARRNSPGACVFQAFTKNPRQLKEEILSATAPTTIRTHEYLAANPEVRFFSHASYLLNMSNEDNWEAKVKCGVAELINVHLLGGVGTVFHVGKKLKLTTEKGVELMERYIVEVLEKMYEKYPENNVKFILETAAGQGSELLYKVEDFGRFIKLFQGEKYAGNPAVKGHVQCCVDTAHIFAAGWSLCDQTKCEKTLTDIATHIGWENVACIHLNDSLKMFHSCTDRHHNIGKGFIGENLKYFFQTSLVKKKIPHILETPYEKEEEIYVTHNAERELIKEWLFTE